MRKVGALLLLAVLLLSGCLTVFDERDPDSDRAVRPADVVDAPEDYTVDSYAVRDATLNAFDGESLAVRVYEPVTRQARDNGTAVQFPVLLLLHTWGTAKEYYENVPPEEPPSEPSPEAPTINLMERFAQAGFITVAHDSRGFGQSSGQVTVAGSAEMKDIATVIEYVQETYNDSGLVGAAGVSLGGGTALRAMTEHPDIVTAASVYGWLDLYDALVPGDVPKLEWATALYGTGQATSGGDLHPDVSRWLQDAYTRTNMAGIEAALDARSTRDILPFVDKPVMFCQGMQETLFPQIDDGWESAGGFSRSFVFTGGHGTHSPACWDRIVDWMDFFLRGGDTRVDDWPFLQTVDAMPDGPMLGLSASQLDRTSPIGGHLHFIDADQGGVLSEGSSQATFTIEQRYGNNPFQVPSVVSDEFGEPGQAVPEELRQDPGAVFFDGGELERTQVLLGKPVVSLRLAGNDTADFQVVTTLMTVGGDGDSRILSRGAYAFIDGVTDPFVDQTIEVPMHWTKATVPAGDRLVLKVSANDSSWFAPLVQADAPYGVTFTGESRLDVPVFAA